MNPYYNTLIKHVKPKATINPPKHVFDKHICQTDLLQYLGLGATQTTKINNNIII